MLDRIFDLDIINKAINNFNDDVRNQYYDYLINEFGDIIVFNETIQQLSIMTFKNMQKYYENE